MSAEITTVVIYHGGCPDGTAAAWALSLALDNSKTYYHYGRFNEKSPDVKDKEVIFVDFTYPADTILTMLQEATNITVLDHHESARPLTLISDPKFKLHLDLDRSGAQMAWDYAKLHSSALEHSGDLEHTPAKYGTNPAGDCELSQFSKEVLLSNNRPWFIDDIADRDLWRWQIPGSKNTTRCMFSMGIYEKINSFYKLLNVERSEYVAIGAVLNADDDRIYNGICRSAVDCIIKSPDGTQEWKVRAVECDHSFASEAGNRLCLDGKCDFAISYRYNLPKNEWWISCRALPESSIDLTKIVKLFDPKSGGHPKASGMTLKGGDSLQKLLTVSEAKFA